MGTSDARGRGSLVGDDDRESLPSVFGALSLPPVIQEGGAGGGANFDVDAGGCLKLASEGWAGLGEGLR